MHALYMVLLKLSVLADVENDGAVAVRFSKSGTTTEVVKKSQITDIKIYPA